jgi:hypothetical protein
MKRAVGAVVVLLGVLTVSSRAGAATVGPEDKGWWSKAQAAPAPAPKIPVDTATGTNLMVGNDPSGPNAVAAVRYSVPGTIDGEPVDASTASGTLTLKVAANGVVGTPVVEACPIISSWQSAAGGPWDAQPRYTCATKAVGTFNTDTTAATFALPSNLQSRPGVFDLALVPDPTNQTPFSVQFTAPAGDSLDVRAAGPPTAAPEPDTSSAPVDSSSPSFDTTGAGAFPSVLADLGVTPNGAPANPAGNAGATSVASSPTLTFATPRPLLVSDKRGERAVALALLVALGLAVWWFGGRPVRAPRLLGSLGDDKVAEESVFVRSGGIGRFARPRGERPPRL